MVKRFSIYLLLALLAVFSCTPEEETGEKKEEGGFPKNWTVSGTVKGNDGSVIAGVVVSDGHTCVKTDSNGYYALEVDLSGNLQETLQYVFVSTPKDWAAPKADGHAIFWKWLYQCGDITDGKLTGVDFTLTRIANPDRFTLYIFGDPQPRSDDPDSESWVEDSAFHSLDICNDMYKDMKEYAATMTDRPVYGICLGDVVHQQTNLLTKYRSGMAGTGITTYNVIGNHDQGHKTGLTDEQSSKAYEKVMGPTNYSFNLGDLHFLMLDNMIIRKGSYSDDCETGITDDIWQFVQNDLKLVPSTARIMICAHSPMFRLLDGSDRKGQHLSEMKSLLGRFKRVYAWAGHTHSTFNWYSQDSNVEVHTLGRVTGALWTNEFISENGTPRGYMVFDYDAGDPKYDIRWKFKPIFWQTATHAQKATAKEPSYQYRDWYYDASGRAKLKATGEDLTDKYQMQVFAPGTYDEKDKTVYVNVFLWDEAWKKPRFQLDGANTASTMSRITEDNGGDLYRYSYADWDITDFYAGNWPNLKTQWYDVDDKDVVHTENKKRNCASMFRYKLNTNKDTGRGTVTVVDRFGVTHETTIVW
ncbi:MAG: calcineurin-like phosphoesterase family protein [Bacteroidales bacterium]|nr:calcineurin-like phosphoesterase family protein [Bacteroidales bacterium]